MSSSPQRFRVASTHMFDRTFREAYAKASWNGGTVVEFGFGGLGQQEPKAEDATIVSGWLPGDRPTVWRERLQAWRTDGKRFRMLVPERLIATTREAHRLFTRKHLGTTIHFLAKVQAHPARLAYPESWRSSTHWLCDPVLNRLPAALWFQGPVAETHFVRSEFAKAVKILVLLQHTRPNRFSMLDITLSQDFVQGTEPALEDRIECTGSDGFLIVNGIWQQHCHLPRLQLNRGSLQSIQRDLERDPEQLHRKALLELHSRREIAETEKLAFAYLDACERVLQAIQNSATALVV